MSSSTCKKQLAICIEYRYISKFILWVHRCMFVNAKWVKILSLAALQVPKYYRVPNKRFPAYFSPKKYPIHSLLLVPLANYVFYFLRLTREPFAWKKTCQVKKSHFRRKPKDFWNKYPRIVICIASFNINVNAHF